MPQPRGRQIGGGLELEAAGRVQGPEVIDGPLLRVVLLQRLVGEDLPRAEGGGVGAGEEVPRSEPLREAVADDGDAAEVDELLVGKEARRARVLQERARVEQPPVEGLADGGEGLGGDGVRGLALGPRGGGEDALHLAEGEEVVVEEEREELDPEGAEDFDGDACGMAWGGRGGGGGVVWWCWRDVGGGGACVGVGGTGGGGHPDTERPGHGRVCTGVNGKIGRQTNPGANANWA